MATSLGYWHFLQGKGLLFWESVSHFSSAIDEKWAIDSYSPFTFSGFSKLILKVISLHKDLITALLTIVFPLLGCQNMGD